MRCGSLVLVPFLVACAGAPRAADTRTPDVVRFGGATFAEIRADFERRVLAWKPLPPAVLVAVPEDLLDELYETDDPFVIEALLGEHGYEELGGGWPIVRFADTGTWLIGTFVLDPVPLLGTGDLGRLEAIGLHLWRMGIPYGAHLGGTSVRLWLDKSFSDRALDGLLEQVEFEQAAQGGR